MSLIDKINNREARVCVIGVGYVGLPVKQINEGKSYVGDVPSKILSEVVSTGRVRATTDFSVLVEMDTMNICVPTPLRKTRDPDTSHVVSAVKQVRKYLRKGQLVILESTTYPGTTEEVILPILVTSGLKVGEDFFLAFSPERVDPGNKEYTTKNIPKVVGGITEKCTDVASALYGAASMTTVRVSSANVAEMVKLLENTFRSVNIGLVNEIALMSNKMGIDVWEVIEAAATKPFGFMPFYPGPGLGGHCIPVDPFYLSWKAKLSGSEARFIELAGQINGSMPEYVVSKIADALNQREQSVNGSRVLILGVAYKSDTDDIRESPALDIIRLLNRRGARVIYHDPLIRDGHEELAEAERVSLTKEVLTTCDCAAIVTGHTNVAYDLVVEHAPVVVDTRNALKNFKSDKIIKL
jgi:UDP-N-acetyl-D-glucosamine dehydrogenase